MKALVVNAQGARCSRESIGQPRWLLMLTCLLGARWSTVLTITSAHCQVRNYGFQFVDLYWNSLCKYDFQAPRRAVIACGLRRQTTRETGGVSSERASQARLESGDYMYISPLFTSTGTCLCFAENILSACCSQTAVSREPHIQSAFVPTRQAASQKW